VAEATPLLEAAIGFAYVGGAAFVAVASFASFRRGRPHPLLLVCVSAISFSWLEAPYDWAVYAQFPPAIPRMPSWWPLNLTWGGLPAAVPPGYVAYFALPAVIGAALGRWASARFQWRAPITLLTMGLAVGCVWAFAFNAILGARLGVVHYGRVIEGLALWPGTRHQYPLYDAYLLGRTDPLGRTVLDVWADSRSKSRLGSSLRSIAAAVVIGHAVYLTVFAPHLATKLLHLQTVGPTEPLFEGVPNQPL
jgi:hypothetical protein